MHRSATRMLLGVSLAAMWAGTASAADDTALRLANVNSGNTGYVRVASSAAFSLQQFTLEAWVQRVGTGYGVTTDALGAGIIDKPAEGTAGSNLGSWHLNWTNSGQALFQVVHTLGTSGAFILTPAVATPLGRHHLAATFDGAMLSVFVDGALAGQTPWTLGTVYYGAEDVLIGAENFGAGYLRRFDGFIDDVRVWDHARTADQIAAWMNCRFTGSDPGLVAYWTFDGSDLSDLTGHGHGGAIGGLAGSVTFAALAPLSQCTVGVDGGAGEAPAGLAMTLFPQPAHDRVTVSFELPRPGPVTLDLVDVAGRRVAVLASREYTAGRHQLAANLAAVRPGGLHAGMFFVRLRCADRTTVRPLLLLK